MNWLKRFWKSLGVPVAQTKAYSARPFAPPQEDTPNNFTPRAQQVLGLARREADRFNHNFVGTEHVLLGLIALGQGVAVNVLKKFGLNLDTVRSEVEKQVGTGPDQQMIGNIPYTPRVKKVLALAAKEAKELSHNYVGTEHILLGLLREGDGVAARVLNNLNVDTEKTRREILKELDPNFSSTSEESRLPGNPATQSTDSKTKPPATSKAEIDLSANYDVYCSERNQDVVVYRNARFIALKKLFPENRDTTADFYELQQADGQTIFVAKYSVIKFCPPGTTPGAEKTGERI